jgi:hypothetical protein
MSVEGDFLRIFHISFRSKDSSGYFFEIVKVHDGAVDMEEAGVRLVVDQDQVDGGINTEHDEGFAWNSTSQFFYLN